MNFLPANGFKITPNSSLRHISHALAERKALQAQIKAHDHCQNLRRMPNSRFSEVKFKMLKQEIGSSSYPIPAEISGYLYPSRVSCLSTFPIYSKYS